MNKKIFHGAYAHVAGVMNVYAANGSDFLRQLVFQNQLF